MRIERYLRVASGVVFAAWAAGCAGTITGGDAASDHADVVSPHDVPTTDAPAHDVPAGTDVNSLHDALAMPDVVTAVDVPAPTDVPTAMDVYTPPPMDCSGSASGTSSIWTCNSAHTARQRCVSGAVQTEGCPNGCVPQPLGTDDFCASSSGGCATSASGTSSIWTCTADRTQRQRCVSGAVQTESCAYGCVPQPTGTDDYCMSSPPPPGSVACAYPQWWTLPYSWNPGYYAISYPPYIWDNDLSARSGTPVQLRHASQLVRQGVHLWGWEPEFIDMVTGHHFAFLHLQPAHQLTTTVGMTYPAGTLVGYSGGDTTDTGYCVAIPGCGTANCSTGTCVYSTGAHLCVQTDASYRTAFPNSTDPCM